MIKYLLNFLGILFIVAWGCSDVNGPGPQKIIRENGKVFIQDRSGKRWDVTHAEQVYGLKAEQFQFGLGPQAIPPILTPQFIGPGNPGYPANNETFLIIGASINDISRAYPISVLSRHEVVDEKFDSTFVAVAY